MKVLVGVDGSEYSNAALRFITEIQWPKGTRFLVLSAAPPVSIGPGEALPPASLASAIEEDESRYLNAAERAATELRRHGLSTEIRMVRANAQTALVDTARREGVDEIIVGSHGRTGLKKLFLGSVASYVVDHAPCAVLVVRGRPKRAVPDQPAGSASSSLSFR